MENLGRVGWEERKSDCCHLGGRLVSCDSQGGRIRLREFVLGDPVRVRVTETDLEAIRIDAVCHYTVASSNGRILVFGRSQDNESVVSCLIDPFTGLEDRSGEIRRDNVTVEWLEVEIDGFEYAAFSEIVMVGGRIIFGQSDGVSLWELKVDEKRRSLTGKKLGIALGHGRGACLQPVSDHEMIVIGGRVDSDAGKVSLADLDSGTVQTLPPPPYWGRNMSSILLLNRFILVAGGAKVFKLIEEMSILDLRTRRWSMIRRGSDWWGRGLLPILSLSGRYIYFIRDHASQCCRRISLDSLALLIAAPGMQSRFLGSMGYSPQQMIQLLHVWRDTLADLAKDRCFSHCPSRM